MFNSSQESVTVNEFDENKIDPNNLFKYPLDINTKLYHYRGQLPIYDSMNNSYSQLCTYFPLNIDKLPKKDKYVHLYSIIHLNEGDNEAKVLCNICKSVKVVEYFPASSKGNNVLKINVNNFFKHAIPQHPSEFSEKDLKEFYETKLGQSKLEQEKKSNIKHNNSIVSLMTKGSSSLVINKANGIVSNNINLNKGITSDLANLIIYGNFPFQFIENPFVRLMIRSVVERLNVKDITIKFQSRRTVTRKVKEIVDGIY